MRNVQTDVIAGLDDTCALRIFLSQVQVATMPVVHDLSSSLHNSIHIAQKLLQNCLSQSSRCVHVCTDLHADTEVTSR